MKKLITILAVILFTANVYAQHYIGENYGGGIVFHVYDNGQHGLIAATADHRQWVAWFNGTYVDATPVRNDGLGIGRSNTDFITAAQGHVIPGQLDYAAFICARYAGSGYSDWYLPSKYELNLLYLQKNVVGGFSSVNKTTVPGGFNHVEYWSSSEFNIRLVYYQNFNNGTQDVQTKDKKLGVRTIRSF